MNKLTKLTAGAAPIGALAIGTVACSNDITEDYYEKNYQPPFNWCYRHFDRYIFDYFLD
ncbi:hypothetical protein VKX94_07705 [Lactobacillus helveticus]|uniref:Lipoprotein n=1 Tax=Lactobacillus helveticus CIRM-BIA 951 TaxID=1226334 RepID=U6F2J5_LACHE|nr:hypothetical protein [Lactobacillus helveticus]MDY0991871.1 hypothetical protein [Lactobacillus helveticus]MDY1002551.1 hypothetical protein [Lactobacillus helveticus]MEB2874391.1 hypothetical protein [Lactobacillus helveticus]NRO83023.1 hypothetical protein [Lactobacillus helveticus]CDI58146.1 Putative uncharacterized protein [Lactobacillus helveticus CIRM-BIA 951]